MKESSQEASTTIGAKAKGGWEVFSARLEGGRVLVFSNNINQRQ
jgi:hypothetical protein